MLLVTSYPSSARITLEIAPARLRLPDGPLPKECPVRTICSKPKDARNDKRKEEWLDHRAVAVIYQASTSKYSCHPVSFRLSKSSPRERAYLAEEGNHNSAVRKLPSGQSAQSLLC